MRGRSAEPVNDSETVEVLDWARWLSGFRGGLIQGAVGRAGDVDGVRLPAMDLIGGHQANAGVVMVLVVAGEEAAAERLGVPDASEALGSVVAWISDADEVRAFHLQHAAESG